MMSGGVPGRVRVSGAQPPTGGAAFNSYAAGRRHYGSGRPAPNVGKSMGKVGYATRDASAQNRIEALQRRLQEGKI